MLNERVRPCITGFTKPSSDRVSPGHIGTDEIVIHLDNERYWPDAAPIREQTIWSTRIRTNAFAKVHEKHDTSTSPGCSLTERHHSKNACSRHRLQRRSAESQHGIKKCVQNGKTTILIISRLFCDTSIETTNRLLSHPSHCLSSLTIFLLPY